MFESLAQLQELGMGVAAVLILAGALVWMVRAFLKHIEKKDAAFILVVNNHLSEEKELKIRLIESHDRQVKSNDLLQQAIEKLINRL